jgi:hypothetical protein
VDGLSDFTGFSHDCNTGKNTDIKRKNPEQLSLFKEQKSCEPVKEEPKKQEVKEEKPKRKLTRPTVFPKTEKVLNKREISEQEKEQLREQYKEEIDKADKAYTKATDFAKQNKKKFPTKTFASNGKIMMSGWTGKTNAPPPAGCSRVEPEEIADHCDKIDHNLPMHPQDKDWDGQWNACHAEKQLSMKTTEPIGISKEMCENCQNYFRKQAQFKGKTLVTKDPKTTRIFYPDGTFVEL